MEIKILKEGNVVFFGNVEKLSELKSIFINIKSKNKELGINTDNYEVEGIKSVAIQDISNFTEGYVNTKLKELDEDLADLATEIADIETRLLILIPNSSSDEIKKKVGLFILGQYNQEQAIQELQQKGLNEEQINGVLQLLARAVEIAKIVNWKETIWKREGELEKEIENKSLDELLELDIEQMCREAYKDIVLDV